MGARHAVLIGVPKNRKDSNLDLPIVHNDILAVHASLEACGYVVKSYGIDDPAEASANLIEDAIDEACREAPANSTLLFYFSGHGVHYNGKDLLVPWDGHFRDPTRIERSLVDTNISRFVDRSAARLVVFFVDACREGMQSEFKSSTFLSWGHAKREPTGSRRFVLVYSCRPGELSQYLGGANGFSLFSKALATVLAPTHPAESLLEVVRATQSELDRLIKEAGKTAQHIRIAGEQELETEYFAHKLSDGHIIEGSARGLDANWVEAATGSRLWRMSGSFEHASGSQIIESVANFVGACENEWTRADEQLPADPWRDHTYPLRVIACLEMLVNSSPLLQLSPMEASVLVSVPFVREGIFSCAISRMATANPLKVSSEPNQTSSALRRRLEVTFSAFPQVIRKAARARNQTTRDAIAFWLMHRSIVRDPNVWQLEPDGYISSQFSVSLEIIDKHHMGLQLTRQQLIDFAQCVGCDPARIERGDRAYVLRERTIVGDGIHEQELREQLLGYLLCLAGWMALDVRAMSDVLPDHLVTADPVKLINLHRALRTANWKASGKGRSVDMCCDHPAIDFAVRDLVLRCNDVLSEVHGRVFAQNTLRDLGDLPVRLGTELIKPEVTNGKAAYETPHLNFHLAQNEVRELLMGEHLYDQPELALRELYQNALDACRYRRARLQYLERTGRLESSNQWEGQIDFVQGKDFRKGRYIECRDNGIGMGRRELQDCFAKAGRRFCDLPEFLEEQNEWLRCEPPIRMYPNSQFGVGVFSYFMLADEIEIETCRMDRHGRPGNRLIVSVPGSGSLFRVQELGTGTDAGTRIRLYLRDDEKLKSLSCVRALIQILWVAEFETHARHGWRRADWRPDMLRYPGLRKHKFPKDVEVPIWWTTERGQFLADGIAVDPAALTDKVNALLSTGLVVNLIGERKPGLTVDRRKIRSIDIEWILENARMSIRSLPQWEGLSFMWLWTLLSVFPELESTLNRSLVNNDGAIPVKGRVTGSTQNIGYNRGILEKIEERVLGVLGQNADVLKIQSSYRNVDLSPNKIGLDKVRTTDVDVRLMDACLWRLVWEAWNWEFQRRESDGPRLEYELGYQTYGLPIRFLRPPNEGYDPLRRSARTREDFLLNGRLRLKQWFKNLKINGPSRLRVWQEAGLILPEWLTEILDDLETKGLSDHYVLNTIPKSRVAFRRLKDKMRSMLLKLRHAKGHPLRRVPIAIGSMLVSLLVIYYLVLFAIILTKKALQ
jgi:hypothetical protein